MSKLDNDTALTLIQEDFDENEYEAIEEMVDDGFVKHDTTAYYSIFLRKADNTFWKVNYHHSYDYGLDEHSLYVCEVQKKEVVIFKWVEKRSERL